MYAVVEIGGRQYRVTEGDKFKVELLATEAGSDVSFDKILMVTDGDNTVIGRPYVEGASVNAKILEHGKGKKIVFMKFHPKKDYRRKQGHRQPYTLLEITAVQG